jgi:hypothetical protein
LPLDVANRAHQSHARQGSCGVDLRGIDTHRNGIAHLLNARQFLRAERVQVKHHPRLLSEDVGSQRLSLGEWHFGQRGEIKVNPNRCQRGRQAICAQARPSPKPPNQVALALALKLASVRTRKQPSTSQRIRSSRPTNTIE